jgi:hypothetical protein
MGTPRRGELTGKPLALRIMQSRRLLKTLLGLSARGVDRCTQIKEPLFRVAHTRDEDATLAATPSAKASHHFFACLPEVVGWAWELGRPATALRSDGLDAFSAFFCAFYRVVASVTRGLPCSQGQVSMTRCAGLTRPSAIAAAAWLARSSSMRASSMRPRNSHRVSGSTQWA